MSDNAINESEREEEILKLKEEAMSLLEKKKRAIFERDEILQEQASLELVFSGMHRNYEEVKEVINNVNYNKKLLRNRDRVIPALMNDKEAKLIAFKAETKRAIDKMNGDFIQKLNAIIDENEEMVESLRMTNIQIQDLEAEVEQKFLENEELNQVVRDLIGENEKGTSASTRGRGDGGARPRPPAAAAAGRQAAKRNDHHDGGARSGKLVLEKLDKGYDDEPVINKNQHKRQYSGGLVTDREGLLAYSDKLWQKQNLERQQRRSN